MLGPGSARVRIEEFGDFQCPFCGTLHPVLKKLESEYDSRVALTFREFPLAPIHLNAVYAAHAAEAAGMQDRFWQMHDLLYEHQQDLDDVDLRQYALKIGLEIYRFDADLSSERFAHGTASSQSR